MFLTGANMHRGITWIACGTLLLAGAGWWKSNPAGRRVVLPAPVADSHALEKIAADGLHNVYRISAKLMSGSSPDGVRGFQSLRDLGVQTILSVDGAPPDVETAKKFGLRYVHVPIVYDGIPRPRVLEIARAVRDLPGPVYVHCHHGKHRGPCAAVAACLCLDDSFSAERAIDIMQQAGTDPKYRSLYALPRTLVRPSNAELDRAPSNFPERAQVPDLAKTMVQIDSTWDRLKTIQNAGWRTPPAQADLDPRHEALQAVEHYREAARLEDVKRRPVVFQALLRRAESDAEQLGHLLESAEQQPAGKVEKPKIDKAFRKAGGTCTECHARFRD